MNIKYQLKPYKEDHFRTKEELKNYYTVLYGVTSDYIDNNIEEVDTDADEYILRNIPKEFHSALQQQAYEDEHAYGYDEVRWKLMELVDRLEDPIKEFKKNIIESLKH